MQASFMGGKLSVKRVDGKISDGKISDGKISDEDLTCPICSDMLCRPVTLGCQHRLCRNCLAALTMDFNRNGCPICRQPTALPDLCTFKDTVFEHVIVSRYGAKKYNRAARQSDRLFAERLVQFYQKKSVENKYAPTPESPKNFAMAEKFAIGFGCIGLGLILLSCFYGMGADKRMRADSETIIKLLTIISTKPPST
jgi:hypothetical protein